MNNAYIIHANYDDLLNEIAKLRNVDKDLSDKLTSFVTSLREITLKLEPALRRESHQDEQKLGKNTRNCNRKNSLCWTCLTNTITWKIESKLSTQT